MNPRVVDPAAGRTADAGRLFVAARATEIATKPASETSMSWVFMMQNTDRSL
jgi:hypothetical protein